MIAPAIREFLEGMTPPQLAEALEAQAPNLSLFVGAGIGTERSDYYRDVVRESLALSRALLDELERRDDTLRDVTP